MSGNGNINLTAHDSIAENASRAHSPQLAAGLASEYKRRSTLHFEDSLQLAAGSFNAHQEFAYPRLKYQDAILLSIRDFVCDD